MASSKSFTRTNGIMGMSISLMTKGCSGTTSTTTFGTVTEVTPDSVNVTVDKYVTSYRLPVTVRQVGEYPAGFYGASPTLDPSIVSVSGPESVVSQIARVVVDFDASRLPAQSGLVRTALSLRYEDEDGNAISSAVRRAGSQDSTSSTRAAHRPAQVQSRPPRSPW